MADPGETVISHYEANKAAALATLNTILALHLTEQYPIRLAY